MCVAVIHRLKLCELKRESYLLLRATLRRTAMAFFGQKNPRRYRASRVSEIGASHGILPRLIAALKDRGVLARLSLAIVAVLVLTVIVEGWRSPFRFRIGDRPAHGVLATVDFQRVDRRETGRRRDQAEAQVPLYFRHQHMQRDQITASLRSDFQTVSEVMSANDLPTTLRRSFGLDLSRAEEEDEKQRAASEVRFQQIRNLVLAADANHTRDNEQLRLERTEGLLAEFQRLVAAADESGLIDEDDVSTLKIQPGKRLVLLSESTADQERFVSLSDVELKSLLDLGGNIAVLWPQLPLLNQIRPQMEAWLRRNLPETLRHDRSKTQEARRLARERIEEVYDDWFEDQVLVGPGELIDDELLELLQDEHRAAEAKVPGQWRVLRVVTCILMIGLLFAINGYYLVSNEPKVVRSFGRLTKLLVSVIIAIALGRWLSGFSLRAELIPVTVAAMIFAVAYNQVMAALTAITIGLILTLSTVGELSQFVILLSVSVTAVIPLKQVSSRLTLIKIGFVTGLAYVLVFSGMAVLEGGSLNVMTSEYSMLIEALKGAGWCLVAGYIVAGSLPLIESAFGVVTDISLLELSDISHPLLQELVRRAPGTYNHSIAVATIAETAAEAIDANGLLVRVGAYYHDIGKMLKPEYFVENMTEGMKSRHDNLAPAMSTLIIIGHVKDGVDLALQHHIPQSLIDFIEQHHGTTLVRYFFVEATKLAEEDPDFSGEVQESSFRYPGPKPQSREAGVLMLADAVESASRALSDPTPKRIETLVHKITMDRLLDGQFEESSLTLSEIRVMEESLSKSLIAIYHGRIKYPDQRTA